MNKKQKKIKIEPRMRQFQARSSPTIPPARAFVGHLSVTIYKSSKLNPLQKYKKENWSKDREM